MGGALCLGAGRAWRGAGRTTGPGDGVGWWGVGGLFRCGGMGVKKGGANNSRRKRRFRRLRGAFRDGEACAGPYAKEAAKAAMESEL